MTPLARPSRPPPGRPRATQRPDCTGCSACPASVRGCASGSSISLAGGLCRELVALRADAALVMSLDDLLLAMLPGPPPAGVMTAGILFKPSFHYGAFEHDERNL